MDINKILKKQLEYQECILQNLKLFIKNFKVFHQEMSNRLEDIKNKVVEVKTEMQKLNIDLSDKLDRLINLMSAVQQSNENNGSKFDDIKTLLKEIKVELKTQGNNNNVDTSGIETKLTNIYNKVNDLSGLVQSEFNETQTLIGNTNSILDTIKISIDNFKTAFDTLYGSPLEVTVKNPTQATDLTTTNSKIDGVKSTNDAILRELQTEDGENNVREIWYRGRSDWFENYKSLTFTAISGTVKVNHTGGGYTSRNTYPIIGDNGLVISGAKYTGNIKHRTTIDATNGAVLVTVIY